MFKVLKKYTLKKNITRKNIEIDKYRKQHFQGAYDHRKIYKDYQKQN